MKIFVRKIFHIEMDDIFTFQNFKPSIFNQEEVSILYQNTREEEFNKFTNVVVEVKYSKRNFNGLVEQLKKIMMF